MTDGQAAETSKDQDTAVEPPALRERFLGVEHSFRGKRWEARPADPRQSLALTQRLGVPELVGRVMAARGVTPDQAETYLDPSLRQALPDPSHLKDMDRAVERLVRAIADNQRVAVFGDYDVDGATSSALLARFFRCLGRELIVYIPDRIAEGYGPNGPALKRLRAEGVQVVITVDCGTTAVAALEVARDAGLDVVVVDHHAAEPRLPPAIAVINPNRLDETSPHRQLAAVGVTFLLVVALSRALRKAGWFRDAGRPEPDLLAWLDLVALGTVCDVVPLTGLNRAYVAQGLKVLARRGNPGLAALGDVAGADQRPDTFHLGFLLGPRVNAGGRVGEAPLGAQLLGTDDPAEAAALAARLDTYNSERKEIERAVLDQALSQAEAAAAGAGGLVCVAAEGWHPGVVGIVASRLKERFGLPALVIALDGGVGKGSGRSVPGVDLGANVIAARQAGLLINGGGHPMAAGLTVAEQNLGALRDFLDERLARQIAASGYRPALGFDGTLQPGAADAELVRLLERLGPFGAGNAEPRFALPAVSVEGARVVGENHVSCRLRGSDGARLKAIAFRALDGELGARLLKTGGLPLHVAGKLRPDSWTGPDAVQLFIEDAAAVQG
jgi:single-stranded-DNA-specific exonuclease